MLVKDINPGPDRSGAYDGKFATFNGRIYFAARDAEDGAGSGLELWSTDGTEAGTARVKDINPGAASSYPQHFLVAGDNLCFDATDAAHGNELWKTDGTEAGTRLVKDIRP